MAESWGSPHINGVAAKLNEIAKYEIGIVINHNLVTPSSETPRQHAQKKAPRNDCRTAVWYGHAACIIAHHHHHFLAKYISN